MSEIGPHELTWSRTRSLTALIKYMESRADQDVTLDDAMGATGAPRSTVNGQLARLVKEDKTGRWVRVRQGFYRYNSTPQGPDSKAPNGYMLEVLATQPDGKIIVRDLETSALFVLTALTV